MRNKGLFIGGPCENADCEAGKVKSTVIVNHGMGYYDFELDKGNDVCPKCKT